MENIIYFVKINQENYEYDVNAIFHAFYPERSVKVLTPESRDYLREPKEGAESFLAEILFSCAGARMRLESREYEWQIRPGEDVRGSGSSALGEFSDAEEESLPASSGQRESDCGRQFKDGFKAFLYQSLRRHTGRELPWGNLTGVRPTKIAYSMLEEGKNEEEILRFYRERHFVSERKGRLSVEIAAREREILKKVHYRDGYSLYIGIPFCPTTCLYCSFTSYPIESFRRLADRYVDCVIREMDFVSKRYEDRILDCVYIGGGTPTTLEPEQLHRLLGSLEERFDLSRVQEFTVEAGRADSITEEKLAVLRRHGVGRISVNPQTMKQETLDIIGRKASVEQVYEAYGLARRMGFDNINMDLILGLPGETGEDVRHTVDRVEELAPDSLTVHSLAIKRASKLNQWIQKNGVPLLHNTDETMEIAGEGAERLGMRPYYLYRQKNMAGNFENVGYARPGKYGLYNILIMEEMQTIAALGAGSISKRVYPDGRIERCENIKDVTLYIEKIDEMIERKRRLLTEEGRL